MPRVGSRSSVVAHFWDSSARVRALYGRAESLDSIFDGAPKTLGSFEPEEKRMVLREPKCTDLEPASRLEVCKSFLMS